MCIRDRICSVPRIIVLIGHYRDGNSNCCCNLVCFNVIHDFSLAALHWAIGRLCSSPFFTEPFILYLLFSHVIKHVLQAKIIAQFYIRYMHNKRLWISCTMLVLTLIIYVLLVWLCFLELGILCPHNLHLPNSILYGSFVVISQQKGPNDSYNIPYY